MSTVEDAFVAYRTTRDPAALAAVYDGTSSRLLAVALHLSGSSSAAEDAVQDTFLFALQHPERWDATRPLIPWLLGILTNLLKQSAYRARRAPDPERLQVPENPSPESELAAAELLSQIESAITDLPQPYRTVVLLRLRNGLSPADIAVALDRKPSTVRVQLTRGVEMLRKVLPTAVAALLIGSATAAQGLATAREVVMQRAHEVHHVLHAQYIATAVKWWSVRALVVSVVALTIWIVATAFAGDPDVPVVAANVPKPPVVAESQVHVAPLLLPSVKETERHSVAVAGSLHVSVQRLGRGMPSALVELEPLGNPPVAIVHHSSSWRGSWRVIESLRPCAPTSIRSQVSSEAGDCVFGELAAGQWICRSLGVAEIVKISNGEVATLRLDVESESQLVRGIVLDEFGKALAGAPIWTCREHLLRVRKMVARTDASGRFTMAVAPFTTVGATHDSYAAVAVKIGREPASPPRDVVLQFQQSGVTLVGVVQDQSGKPVQGAEVEVGHPCDSRVPADGLATSVVARPVRVRTDKDGLFRVASLVPGETTVTAFADGFGVASSVIALRAGEQAQSNLIVPRAAIVRGVIRDSQGKPIVTATVRIGRKGSIYYRVTTTDEHGAYQLGNVTPGRSLIEVTNYRGGFAYQLLECQSGEASTFDAVLSSVDLQLSGRVVNSSGQPLANAWIVHEHRAGRQEYRLDAKGRFSIEVSERYAAIPSSIRVFDLTGNTRPARTAEPWLIAADLRVGSQGLEIRVGARPRSAWLHGSVRIAAGAKLPKHLLLGRVGQRWLRRAIAVADDGTFQAGPLTAGCFELRADGNQRLFGPFDLEAAENLDVGELAAASEALPGEQVQHRRQLALLFPEGASMVQGVQLEVRNSDGELLIRKPHQASPSELSELYVVLPEGRFALRATTKSGLVAEREVVIDASVPVRRALLVQLRKP